MFLALFLPDLYWINQTLFCGDQSCGDGVFSDSLLQEGYINSHWVSDFWFLETGKCDLVSL